MTSSPGADSPIGTRSNTSGPSTATVTTPGTNSTYATDSLCPREMVLWMLDDYLTSLYPLIPVVHRPSFRRAISMNQDNNDLDLRGLIYGLCAAVVGTMPSKYLAYRSHKPPLNFSSRQDFIDHAYTVLLQLRGPDFFDEISYKKFATSYLFDIAYLQIGNANRARMIEVECLQLGRMLNLHRITEYRGLNHIETQLRKKGFWLLFYSYVHGQVQSLRRERLTFLDPTLVETIDLESLIPIDVDDEAIFEDRVVVGLSSRPNLTTAFNLTSTVFWAAIESRQACTAVTSVQRVCQCAQDSRRKQIAHLQRRLQDLKYSLDTIPPELRQWAVRPMPLSPDMASNAPGVVVSQLGAVRGNLHVTQLWLQSILLDQLEALLQDDVSPFDAPAYLATVESRWSERENLCTQLIHVLHAIPQKDLEPNGLHFVFKVRDVAVGLLNCPCEPHEPASLRAAEFVREFTQILSRLDSSEVIATTNLKTWVDTDRERGRKGLHDMQCDGIFGWS
jgi:hypothetical protein